MPPALLNSSNEACYSSTARRLFILFVHVCVDYISVVFLLTSWSQYLVQSNVITLTTALLARSALLFCIQFHVHDRNVHTEKQILELSLTNEYFTTFKDACLKQAGSKMV